MPEPLIVESTVPVTLAPDESVPLCSVRLTVFSPSLPTLPTKPLKLTFTWTSPDPSCNDVLQDLVTAMLPATWQFGELSAVFKQLADTTWLTSPLLFVMVDDPVEAVAVTVLVSPVFVVDVNVPVAPALALQAFEGQFSVAPVAKVAQVNVCVPPPGMVSVMVTLVRSAPPVFDTVPPKP